MVIKQFKLTSEHVKKLEELGYRKIKLKDRGCETYAKYSISGRSRIEVVYIKEISWLCILTDHMETTIIHFGEAHKLYDEYVHVWETLKEDMENVFGIDVISERIIEEK